MFGDHHTLPPIADRIKDGHTVFPTRGLGMVIAGLIHRQLQADECLFDSGVAQLMVDECQDMCANRILWLWKIDLQSCQTWSLVVPPYKPHRRNRRDQRDVVRRNIFEPVRSGFLPAVFLPYTILFGLRNRSRHFREDVVIKRCGLVLNIPKPASRLCEGRLAGLAAGFGANHSSNISHFLMTQHKNAMRRCAEIKRLG